MANATRLLN